MTGFYLAAPESQLNPPPPDGVYLQHLCLLEPSPDLLSVCTSFPLFFDRPLTGVASLSETYSHIPAGV